MSIFDNFKRKKEDLPLIARVNLVELKKQRVENMKLGDKSILTKADYTKRIPTIRLYYTAYEKFFRYGSSQLKVGQTHGISSPFRLPNEMTLEEACKVISYLSDKLEKENNLEPGCEQSVAMVSHILDKFGFEKVESSEHGHYHCISDYSPIHRIQSPFNICNPIEGVVDLISVGGDFKIFKKTKVSERYFDWYTPNVTKEEIQQIYKGIRKDYLLEDTCASDNDEVCQ